MKVKSIKYLSTSYWAHSEDDRGPDSPQEIMIGDPARYSMPTAT